MLMKILCSIFALLTLLGVLAKGAVTSLVLVTFCIGLIVLIRKIESGRFFYNKKKSLKASRVNPNDNEDDEHSLTIMDDEELVEGRMIRDNCIVSMNDGRSL